MTHRATPTHPAGVGLHLLSDESAEWLRRMRAQGDSVPGPVPPRALGGSRTALVRCGPLADPALGLYSAVLVERPLPYLPWETPGTSAVRLAELNGGTLTPSRYYLAFASGFDSPNGTPVYWAAETCCDHGSGWPGSGGTGGSGSGSGSGSEEGPDGDPAYLVGCAPCGGDVALPLAWLNFTGKTGSAICLPDSIPLTRMPSMDSSGGFFDATNVGWIPKGASQTSGLNFGDYAYCTDRTERVGVWVTCGSTGVVVKYVGAYGSGGFFTSGPLNGGPVATADQPCGLFASPGVLPLGTLVTTVPLSGSVDVSLSW